MKRTERKHLMKSAAALALTLCLAAPLCACSGNSDYGPTTLNSSQLEEEAIKKQEEKQKKEEAKAQEKQKKTKKSK